MATPIRMAPVLYGKEAEFFYEQWAKMRETPLQRPISKERQTELFNFMKEYNVL
ncbi:MAG: hypothetical protein LBN27_06450 [Prevotellaceae bacterium]|jgi:hypothetical protein|nr:hypothetical protein [Prevotellaceae bacterium]